jgi:hypothetical protein
MKQLTKPLAIAAGIAALVIATSTGTAVAGSLITSHDIKDGAVHKIDLSQGVQNNLHPNHTVYLTHFGGVAVRHPGDGAGLHMTGEGAHFGPFADGGGCTTAGADFARLNFNGLNGKSLSAVHQLDFTGLMVADNDTGGVGSLTMRIYLNGGADRLTFSPNTQYNTPADYSFTQGEVHTWLTTMGTWRLNDDAGNNPAGELPFTHWASAAQNGNDKIDHIDILLGCQAGANLQGVVRSIQANGTDYVLGRIG